jgi:NADH-quinone oxidoreductase subunit L
LHKGHFPQHAVLFYVALVGAAITAFYMFRLWYMTFAGKPRNEHVYEHAHESPRAMLVPLVVLAFFAVVAAWRVPLVGFSVSGLLEQAMPQGIISEHMPEAVHAHVSLIALCVALAGFAVATVYYGLRWLSAETVKRALYPIYVVLRNKWWFDELYGFLFIRPTLRMAKIAAGTDRNVIDRLADGLAGAVRGVARFDDLLDRLLVDGLVNAVASWTYRVGISLRAFQSGNLRQYVVTVAVGTVALFILISLYWSFAMAGY